LLAVATTSRPRQQARSTLAHVEHEQRDWVHAFNLGIGLSSLFASTLFAAGVDAEEPFRVAGSAIGGGAADPTGRDEHGVSAGAEARVHDVLRVQASAARAVATETLTSLLRWVRRDLPASERYVRLVLPTVSLVEEGRAPVEPQPVPASGAAFPAGAAGKRTAPAVGASIDAAGRSLLSVHGKSVQPGARECGPAITSCAAASTHAAQIDPAYPSTVLLLDGDICTRREGVSFHLPLHRFFAALLREAAATPQRARPPANAAAPPTAPADAPLDLGSLLDDVVREVSSWPPSANDLHWADATPRREWLYREFLHAQASCADAAAGPTEAALSWPHVISPVAWSPGASGGEGARFGRSCGAPPLGAAGRSVLREPDFPSHPNVSGDGSGASGESQILGQGCDESTGSGGSLAAAAGDAVDRRPTFVRQRLAMPQQGTGAADAVRVPQGTDYGRPPPAQLDAGDMNGPGSSRMPPRAARPFMSRDIGGSSACLPDTFCSSTSRAKRTAPEGAPPAWPPRLGSAETKRLLLLQLVEHPLRVLTLSAQAGAHLWRRNGAEMLSQVSLARRIKDGRMGVGWAAGRLIPKLAQPRPVKGDEHGRRSS
jgi:hypothetical protein